MKKISLIISCLLCITLDAELFFTSEMISSHLKEYSDEEVQSIEKDLEVVRSICLEGTENTKDCFYLATAGGPGSRKTTILERFILNHPEYQKGVYLDPDPRTLKFMVHTYCAQSLTPLMIASTNNYSEVIKNAYNKWRPGSNYIALTLLEEAFTLGRSVIYGTTSTGAHIPKFFTKLKDRDYQIILLLCSCPDDVRFKAVDYRNNVVRFYQSSPEDAVSKGLFFPQKMETYFSYADQLYFFWSDSLFEKERIAGRWRDGKLEVYDKDAMECFIKKYEMDRTALSKTGLSIRSFNYFLKNEKTCRKNF